MTNSNFADTDAVQTRKPWFAPRIIVSEEAGATSKPHYSTEIYFPVDQNRPSSGPS